MNEMKNQQFDITALVEEVEKRPAPESCREIAGLFESLPPWSSFINTSPKPEQKRGWELLLEKADSLMVEEILFMAEISCGKYHRIRKDGSFSCFDSQKGKELYGRYYQLTGSDEALYILENFDEFEKLCYKSLSKRRRKDEREPYSHNSTLSTSRDPDSGEWKR